MTATGRIRGRQVLWDADAGVYRWADTNEPAAGWGGDERPCPACGLTADPDDGVGGADPCLGVVPGCSTACCGHGRDTGWIAAQAGAPVRLKVFVVPGDWPTTTTEGEHRCLS